MTDIFDLDKPVRKIPIVKQLASKFGGKWRYVGMSSWECDDGIRFARRTCSCFPDDSDECRCFGRVYVYSNDDSPVAL